MHFITKQDIEAPLDFVYRTLNEFDQFERMAARRGAEVERIDRLRVPGPGAAWRLRFAFRGKPRLLTIRVDDLQEDSLMVFGLESNTLDGSSRIDLAALAPRRTRITILTEIRPRTLGARVMLQSVRLARGRVQKKIDGASSKLAAMIEERWRAVQRRGY